MAPSVAPSFAPSFAPSGTVNSEHSPSIAMSADVGGPAGSSAVPTVDGSVYSDGTYPGNVQHPGGPQEFNAWGPDGVYHRVTKAETVISEASAATTTRGTVEVGSSGWTKPVGSI